VTGKTRIIFFALLFFFYAATPAHPFTGGLPYKNQFPLFTHLNAPAIDTARPESSVSLGLSYSSVYMVKDSPAWSVALDMETAELAIRIKKNFHDSVEVGLEAPFLSLNSGFLDGPLESYHSAFGFPDYGRSNRPHNDFLYTVKKDGRTVVSGEGGRAGIGDLSLSVKKTVLSGDPAISLKASVELPTGDAKKGYGSGSTGASISLLADKDIGETVRVYLNLGVSFPGDLRGYERVRLDEFLFAAAAVEAAVFKDLDLVAQAYYEESPYPKTGIAEIDRSSVILSVGGRYTAGENAFEFAFTEDPSTSGAPDFSLTFAFKRRLR
jgi:hypothetical protein